MARFPGQLISALTLLFALAGMAVVKPCEGQYIAPTGYTVTAGQGQAQGGTYNYFDDTGSQLTDGVLGVNNISANLGNGPAYEWVGWRFVDPAFNFTFGSEVTIRRVEIGFSHNEANGGIQLPTAVTIGGQPFAVVGNEFPDGRRGFLTFSGTWTGSALDLNITRREFWLFVDEVRFNQSPVPGPGALAVGLVGSLPGVFALLRRRKRKA